MKKLEFLHFGENDPDGVYEKFSRLIYSTLENRFERSSTFVDILDDKGESFPLMESEIFSSRAELRAVLFCIKGRTRVGAEFLIDGKIVKVVCNDHHRNDSLPIVNRLKLDMPNVWRREFRPHLSKHQAVA